MSEDADVDRLTELLKRLETTPDVVRLSSFKPEILGDCTVGDLRQSLSQEAVRDEALEEAAEAVNHLALYGPPEYSLAFCQAVEAVRALKREPNAAGRATRSPYDTSGLKEYSGD